MRYYVCTLFPDMIRQIMGTSILGRAEKNGYISVNTVNIRDFSQKKSMRVDDYPYGGGAGMVMEPEPVYQAVQSALQRAAADRKAEDCRRAAADRNAGGEQRTAGADRIKESGEKKDASGGIRTRVIYLTPQARVLDQTMVEELAREKELVLLCGHYEGIDERVLQETVTDYVSIGDYVLTGGELGAAVLMDAVSRFVPGVLHNDESSQFESMQDNLLEYPHFTRPEQWHGRKVPPVLLTGDHGKIEEWRYQQAVARTQERRPDLLKNSFVLHTFWYGSQEAEEYASCLHGRISRYGEIQNYNRNKLIRSRNVLGNQELLLLVEGAGANGDILFEERFRNLYGSGKTLAWICSDGSLAEKKKEFLADRGFRLLGCSRYSDAENTEQTDRLALDIRKKALHLAGR
ncbi:MAG: tRNA (guanosine(37)-N1)-methyltransferase TrmD [Lachnospiraceae bacterium]|nr:tRNA (guanosine(37)-N1)-methyltransferase TrmD [Lachnospiraceae bacterium]MDD7049051.1 tRNA (guanosine(37)-N1)-methyltransferase TrmD [Lachnospiraceae bacterium]